MCVISLWWNFNPTGVFSAICLINLNNCDLDKVFGRTDNGLMNM